jgi:5-methylcytosine-specific restriction endonuclease McrA
MTAPKAKRPPKFYEGKRIRRNLRAGITAGKRRRIYERDDYTCQGPCGRRLPPGHPDHLELTLDHRLPVSKGGRNNDDNLQTMCGDCNKAKGNS